MLYYKEYGNKDGQLVIFIHGGFTTNESYAKQFDLFLDKRMIFVDLPGCGNSRLESASSFSFRNAAQAVIELIETLSPDRKVILISHSYGGLVVKKILSQIPERIDKIVVGSTNVQRSPLFWLYTRKLGCLILWLQNQERYMREGISWKCVCDTQKSAWRNFDLNEVETNVKIPCLFLYAEHDIREIRDSMKMWQKKLPNCTLYEIKKSGHNYFYDMPEFVNPVISYFINEK